MKEAFNAFGLVYNKPMISTARRKARGVDIQSRLVRAFAVRIINRKIVLMLQQSAVTGCEGASMAEKEKGGGRTATCRTPTSLAR